MLDCALGPIECVILFIEGRFTGRGPCRSVKILVPSGNVTFKEVNGHMNCGLKRRMVGVGKFKR